MIPRPCAASSARAICLAIGSASSIGHGAARDPIRERRTVDELHHQRVRAAGILETVNLRDVRMIEGREDLRLLMEACEALGARGESGQQAP